MKTSNRREAWENLLVAGVNALLDQGKITLEGKGCREPRTEAWFTYPDGTPCVAFASGITHDELTIVSIYEPVEDPFSCMPIRKSHGRAAAGGWLERETGKHIQTLGAITAWNLHLPRDLSDHLAHMRIEAKGYERSGPFFS